MIRANDNASQTGVGTFCYCRILANLTLSKYGFISECSRTLNGLNCANASLNNIHPSYAKQHLATIFSRFIHQLQNRLDLSIETFIPLFELASHLKNLPLQFPWRLTEASSTTTRCVSCYSLSASIHACRPIHTAVLANHGRSAVTSHVTPGEHHMSISSDYSASAK